MINKSLLILLFVSFYLSTSSFAGPLNNMKWYSKTQVEQGKVLFIENCAFCHGKKAEKTIIWKKPLRDGSYPPPPLNGNAHAWHHPKSQLKRIISNGGKMYDGKMPAFKEVLSSQQQDAVIAYFQDFWTDDIYETWLKNGGLE